jgi:hypothetical protein
MTGEYTFVTPERQNELTRRIQEKLSEAANMRENAAGPAPSTPATMEVPTSLASATVTTTFVQ